MRKEDEKSELLFESLIPQINEAVCLNQKVNNKKDLKLLILSTINLFKLKKKLNKASEALFLAQDILEKYSSDLDSTTVLELQQ